jgi:hypothetical protein
MNKKKKKKKVIYFHLAIHYSLSDPFQRTYILSFLFPPHLPFFFFIFYFFGLLVLLFVPHAFLSQHVIFNIFQDRNPT